MIPGLGDRILERIQVLGWPSATAFALDLHRTPQVIHAWVQRGQTPQWPELERLAVVLRCPLAWLILGDGAFEGLGDLVRFHEELYGKPPALPGWHRSDDPGDT